MYIREGYSACAIKLKIAQKTFVSIVNTSLDNT